MSDISATCSNGHDVLGIEPGTPCPQCGDTHRHVSITVSDSSAMGIEDSVGGLQLGGSGTLSVGGTTSIELRASGSAVGATEWAGRAEGEAPPDVDTQEVILRWTPLDPAAGTWMLQVHREGEPVAIGIGDSHLRAIKKVLKDLYPND